MFCTIIFTHTYNCRCPSTTVYVNTTLQLCAHASADALISVDALIPVDALTSLHTHPVPLQAPEYYDEIQQHIAAQQAAAEGAGGGAAKQGAGGSDFWWDVGGWVLLGAVVTGALVVAKATAKPAA